jgi:hypothetical protein
MQFWDRGGTENEPKENRAMIRSMDILSATTKHADIKSGHRGAWSYLLTKLKSKINKKLS